MPNYQQVEYAMLCDYANLAIGGKLNLNGIFENIVTHQVPAVHSQMFIVSKLVLEKGEHKITFSLMQQDKVLAKTDVEKNVEQDVTGHSHFWGIKNLKIESWDPIELQILIDGKQVFVKRIPVVELKKKEE